MRRFPIGGLLLLMFAMVGLALFSACTAKSREAKEMEQLKAAYTAKPLQPAMVDHLFMDVGDGTYLFLHFDKEVGKESKLLYVGVAVPGRFTKAEQERVERQFGKGFTHFHQGKNCPGANADACHGGKGGEDGYWFRHVAVDSFKMPWGDVKPGTDHNFMPTSPPQ